MKWTFKLIVGLSLVMGMNNIALADNVAIAKKLTNLYKAARAVVAGDNKMIKSPQGAMTVDKFIGKMEKNYLKMAGEKLDINDPVAKNMIAAIKEVVDKAYTGGYDKAWLEGDYAGKFLPARFAAEVAKSFNAKEKGMFIRLTTRKDFLINAKNEADSWESGVIESQFVKSKNSQPVSATAKREDRDAWRYIIPEYYSGACIGCHGGETGKKNHAKSGIPGKVNEFGGAISFGIYN